MKLGKSMQFLVTAAVAAALLFLSGCGAAATATATPAASTATQAAVATVPAPTSTVAAAASDTAVPQATATVAVTPSAAATPAGTAVATTGTPSAAAGEGIVGHWEGAITVAGQDLGIVVEIEATGDGYAGTMTVPSQTATGQPLSNMSYEAPAVHFEAFSGARLAVFEGQLADANTISGTFSQAGYVGTFSMTRGAAAAASATVEASPVPYTQEEVTFSHDDVALAGTLTLPEGSGPFPAVVLISGSGQQNRDEDVFGFGVFGVIADYLTREGIAVLRYDDRGVGGSTGDVENATSEDFAADALAAVEFLAERPEIAPLNIGLLGHSEGGMIAPMVANESDSVAFVILMAGPALRGDQLLMEQLTAVLQAGGASQEQIDAAAIQQQALVSALRTGQGWDAIGTRTATELRATVEALPTADRGALGDVDTYIADATEAQLAAANTPWLRFFVSYDPVPALEALDVPVLALFGSKDVQVPVPSNSDAMRTALEAGGNGDATVEVLQDANHLFQQADTGSPDEYATLPKEFVPGFLDVIAGWILEHVQTAG